MYIKEAILSRIKQLCESKNITLNMLANLSGVTPSTVYSLFENTNNDMGVVVLKKICDGLEISVAEFFNNEIFKILEQEIL